MYNEHFQHPPNVNTSTFPSGSVTGPSPFRVEGPRIAEDLPGSSSTNSLIIQKIEALFPVLEEMAGQNDLRANHIIGKLMGLRESLNEAVGQMESEIDQNGSENIELKNRLKRVEGQPRTVYTEDTEALRRLEQEV